MRTQSTAPPTPLVLDTLHSRIDELTGAAMFSSARSSGYHAALRSARLFVLDERARQCELPECRPTAKNKKDHP
ncbi:hypothetical protein SAMN05444583_107185 [Rhodococcus maanshanensis]|uniref:Uncharacterized protein n=1 Tax=Rhodococcus maanshanensis TaxID=183556 RepID=A0A1H7NZT8_9NOCA|nr:hypothetical protein SAMN05444583_107185 [Rhodococcus maanshanensis]